MNHKIKSSFKTELNRPSWSVVWRDSWSWEWQWSWLWVGIEDER